MRDLIKHIVFEEFSKLTTLIEKDFSGNYKRKVNNFLLSQMDENITASMVFVSQTHKKRKQNHKRDDALTALGKRAND